MEVRLITATWELPAPALDDLVRDFSSETLRFRSYWEQFSRKTITYKSPRSLRKLRSHQSPVYDGRVLAEYLQFLEEQLSRPDLQVRCLLREVFEIALAQRRSYRDFISTQKTGSSGFRSFLSLEPGLARHEHLCRVLGKEKEKGAGSIEESYALLADPQAMISLLEIMVLEPTPVQDAGLRLFCAKCRQLEGDTAQAVSSLQECRQGARELPAVLSELRANCLSELQDLSALIAAGSIDEASYLEIERWKASLIEISDPALSWRELCACALSFAARAGRHLAGGKEAGKTLADMLRDCLTLSS